MDLELAIVLGNVEHAADYRRSPLGVGIGLPKVFWIMCFGEGYSRMIVPKAGDTNFFRRGEFGGKGLKSFVSAASFEAYQSASVELMAMQRLEIGDDLFNRLPVEERRGGAEVNWIMNPTVIARFAGRLYRQYTTGWRSFQAKSTPDYYA